MPSMENSTEESHFHLINFQGMWCPADGKIRGDVANLSSNLCNNYEYSEDLSYEVLICK